MLFEIVKIDSAQFDEDGFCVDVGPVGAAVATFEAPYPRGIDYAAARALAESVGLRLEPGYASLSDFTLSWAIVGGGYAAVRPVEISE